MYLDANVVIYAITGDSRYGSACARWLERIQSGAVRAESSPLMPVECPHAFRSINRIPARRKRGKERRIDIPSSMAALLSLPIRWLDLSAAGSRLPVDAESPRV